MLTCKQITELVTEYLEGRMPLRERIRFQVHLGMCRHCRRYLAQMKTTIRALGFLEPAYASGIPNELLQRFRTWKGRVS
jgi:predicted anti-sigma-YlaC factor YlaD